jgi:hypothetical protein
LVMGRDQGSRNSGYARGILVTNIHIEGMGTMNDVCLDTSIYLHI